MVFSAGLDESASPAVHIAMRPWRQVPRQRVLLRCIWLRFERRSLQPRQQDFVMHGCHFPENGRKLERSLAPPPESAMNISNETKLPALESNVVHQDSVCNSELPVATVEERAPRTKSESPQIALGTVLSLYQTAQARSSRHNFVSWIGIAIQVNSQNERNRSFQSKTSFAAASVKKTQVCRIEAGSVWLPETASPPTAIAIATAMHHDHAVDSHTVHPYAHVQAAAVHYYLLVLSWYADIRISALTPATLKGAGVYYISCHSEGACFIKLPVIPRGPSSNPGCVTRL